MNAEVELLECLQQADDALVLKALVALEKRSTNSNMAREAFRRCGAILRGASVLSTPPRQPNQLSPLLFPVGTTSADGSTVLGLNGYLYLTEGSNYVKSRYERNPDSTRELAQKWIDLLDARAQRQNAAGREYIQFIIPEKISSLPKYLPFELRTPTDLLRIIELHCANPSWDAKFYSPLEAFRIEGERVVARLDSHQSTYGSYIVARDVARLWGVSDLDSVEFDSTTVRSGDLAARFFGTAMFEITDSPIENSSNILRERPNTVETYNPPGGGHLGVRYIWNNATAPIRNIAVAYGNSCFERGGVSLLSWWFARLFREFHFVWSSEIDDDYSERVGAQIVIGQTMERFLFNRVPEK